MDFFLTYYWEVFITIEVLLIGSILCFGVFRYFLNRRKLSFIFIALFLFLLGTEAILGFLVYRKIGEISTFVIIITIFIIYACTFGIFDSIKFDRWMRKKIGALRGIELLTDKDYKIIKRNSDPKFIAKKYRKSSLIHLMVFLIGQTIFWSMGTDSISEMIHYLRDFSWLEKENVADSPYPNETIFSIGVIWGIIFIIDFLYSWSYTLFPKSK